VPFLVDHFLGKYGAELGERAIATEALDRLMGYGWPGNVRELENEIQRMVALARDGDWIDLEQLSDRIRHPHVRDPEDAADREAPPETAERTEVGESTGDLREAMAGFERTRIASVLEQTGGNVSEAARVLGLSRGALHRKLKEHGLR
jgi:DNA-binding NtrC family response regulator